MTKPTDKELRKLAEECGLGWGTGIPRMADFIVVFASEVLSRWGAPPAAAALLRKMEWEEVRYEYRDSQYFCPVCDADKRDGHADACEMAAILRAMDKQSPTTPQANSQPTTKLCLLDEFEKVLDALKNWNNEDDLMWIQYREQVLRSAIAQERIAASTVQGPAAIVHECGNLYAKVKLCGEAFGTTKVGDRLYSAPVSPNDDTALLDWLSHAGPVSMCMVVDRPHDGEYEVSTDYVTGYGKTLREAIRAAIVLQGDKLG